MPKKIGDVKEGLRKEGKKKLLAVGYNRLNINDLLSCCDVSVSTFYNNYQCKQELVIDIMKVDWEDMLKQIDRIRVKEIVIKDKLQLVYDKVYEFFHNYKEVFIDIVAIDHSKRNNNDEFMKSLCNKIETIFKDEINRGTITTNLDIEKLSYIIMQNFIFMSKEDYISFEDFYQYLNIGLL